LEKKHLFFYLALIAIGLAGCYVLLLATPYGMGLNSDSASYVDGAGNLLNGHGYTRTSSEGRFKPITHFPPVFSISLIPLSLVGLDLLQSGRIIVVINFGLGIIMVGLLIQKISHSIPFSILGAILLGISNILLEVYAYLLSEPLFISLMLIAYLFLSKYFEAHRKRWLVLTGFALSLSYLTRYVGLTIIACAVLTILLLETDYSYFLEDWQVSPKARLSSRLLRPFSKKVALPLKEVAILLGSSLPLIIIWTIYTYSMGGGFDNRTLAWHPIDYTTLLNTLKHLLNWLVSVDVISILKPWTRVIRFVSLLVLPGLAIYILNAIWHRIHNEKRTSISSETSTAFSLSLHVILYLLFLFVSISLFDASTPLNYRLLSVAYVPMIVLFSSSVAWLWKTMKSYSNKFGRVLQLLIALACLGLVYNTAKEGFAEVNRLSQDGLGYASLGSVNSQVIRDIRNMPPGLIYSNATNMIFLLTGKPASITPTPIDPVTKLARPEFMQDVDTMHKYVSEGQAMLILFDMKNTGDPQKDSLYKTLTSGLKLQKDYGSSQIFAGEK
jgi:hypothetical protein